MNDESNAADDEVYQASFSDAGTFNYAPQKIQVSRSSLKSVMKSKLDVYNILSKEGQFYPPADQRVHHGLHQGHPHREESCRLFSLMSHLLL